MSDFLYPTNLFFRLCVVRLGLIYFILATLVYVFCEYKVASGFWWMSGIFFAVSDTKAAVLSSSIMIAMLSGFYHWLSAFQKFVVASKLSYLQRLFGLCYLVIGPCAAALITADIYQHFLTDPLTDYRP